MQMNRLPESRMETHTLAKVDSAKLREYTGVYLFSGLFRMVVTLDTVNSICNTAH